MAFRSSQARRSFLSAHDDDHLTEKQKQKKRVCTIIKITIFLMTWAFFSIYMIIREPHEPHEILTPMDPGEVQAIRITGKPKSGAVIIELRGYIDEVGSLNPKLATDKESYVRITIDSLNEVDKSTIRRSDEWNVYLKLNGKKIVTIKKYIKLDRSEPETKQNVKQSSEKISNSDAALQVSLLNKNTETQVFAVRINSNPLNPSIGIIIGFLLLVYLYVLIIFDITDRAFAALLVSSTAVGILTVINQRPTLEKLISWIDMATLLLLLGMMIMVAILAETGVFDWLSVTAYRFSKGQPWCLIFLLCMLTLLLSSILDNVTIILLMVPIVIRLCESMGMRTTLVLICVAIFSNIGGALTPVGDPPNVIIVTNPFVVSQGVDFLTFTIHMAPGVFFSIVVTWAYLYLTMRKKLHSGSDDQMRESLKTLAKYVARMNDPTPEEEERRAEIIRRIEELKETYRRKQRFALQPAENFIETLAEMESKYKIRDKPMLIKCCIALILAIVLFTSHNLPFMRGATLYWISMLAAILLVILANLPDFRVVLDHIEWSTLMFFASLFTLVEAVSELGLIEWVGEKTTAMILSVDSKHRVVAGFMLVMWISAIFSAFIDNIPIVTMMLKLAVKLGSNPELNLPTLPLIWALSFGVCLGGNGTLIAASSNVVAAGIASQHGYTLTFNEFFKYGFPVMLLTDIIVTVYLLIAHGLFHWH